MRAAPIDVVLECGNRRVFASALDWPGWCRSGRGEDAAVESLLAAAPRYAAVTEVAGVPFPVDADQADVRVVERLPGNATTDFGAPDAVAEAETAPLTAAQARQVAALVAAAWQVFDRVAAAAPATLRKGPRGGGRDRDAIVTHVVEAEASYARRIGVRGRLDLAARREAILAVLGAARSGGPVVERGWPPRYAARRIAWHVLDHAWEIEDRAVPAPPPAAPGRS